jgi:O-antigen/teichoic acid export membrane protein
MGPGISLSEKTWHYAWITILTAILNTGLNFILVPRWGYIGAGIATLVSFIVYWQVKVIVAARYFPVNYPFLRINLFFILGAATSLIIALWADQMTFFVRVGGLALVVGSAFFLKIISWQEVLNLTHVKQKKL